MSRSFVRAWATVATIMAMVCFAFVQPMPEHVSAISGSGTAVPALERASDGQIGATAPFVDSIMTGKTFTPYVTLPGWQLLQDRASSPVRVVAVIDSLRSPPLEPPTRPG